MHRWTAEEGRHGIAIRDYLLATRAVDPVALERARMAHMGVGFESDNHNDLLRSLAYVSFQELATRISHRNTGKLTDDPICEQLLARIALDENLHMLFYRNLLAAALELAPDQTMRAITDVVSRFQMPGTTIEGFTRKSVQIAHGRHLRPAHPPRRRHRAGAARTGACCDLEGLDAEGEAAREELVAFLAGLDAAATRFEDQRAARRERLTARGQAYESV